MRASIHPLRRTPLWRHNVLSKTLSTTSKRPPVSAFLALARAVKALPNNRSTERQDTKDEGPTHYQPEIFLRLIASAGKRRSPDQVLSILDKVPENLDPGHRQDIYAAAIRACCWGDTNGTAEVLQILRQMPRTELPKLSSQLLRHTIAVCKEKEALDQLLAFYREEKLMTDEMYEKAVTVYSSKFGAAEELLELLEQMVQAGARRDLRIYQSIMGIAVKQGKYEEALNVWSRRLAKEDFAPDIHLYRVALSAAMGTQQYDVAQSLFSFLQRAYQQNKRKGGMDPDFLSQGLALCLMQNNKSSLRSMAAMMLRDDCPLSSASFHQLLKASVLLDDAGLYRKVYQKMAAQTSRLSLLSPNHLSRLVSAAYSLGLWEDCTQLVKETHAPGTPISYRVAVKCIQALLKSGREKELVKFITIIGDHSLSSLEDDVIYSWAVQGCSKLEDEGKDMVESIVKHRRDNFPDKALSLFLANNLLSFYASRSLLPDARKTWIELLDGGREPNKRSFSLIMQFYEREGRYEEVVDLYHLSLLSGIPSATSMVESTVVALDKLQRRGEVFVLLDKERERVGPTEKIYGTDSGKFYFDRWNMKPKSMS